MINRERLQAITELNSYVHEWQANDTALDSYTKILTKFIDELPAKIEDTRSALSAQDNKAIFNAAAAVCDLLVQIHAGELAGSCMEKTAVFQAMNVADIDMKEIEAYMEEFISNVCSLSIEIQMAIHSIGDYVWFPIEKSRLPVILAVDDSALFLNTLKSYLQGTRYKLTCVVSGDVALRFLEEHSADLFILDIEMPGMDGYETARKIREKGEKAPIIFLTGNATKEYVIKAINVGAADFIVKPINKKEVLKKIAKYV